MGGEDERRRTSKVVTLETSHALISLLKLTQAVLQPEATEPAHEPAQKRYDKSVTCDTSHVLIGP